MSINDTTATKSTTSNTQRTVYPSAAPQPTTKQWSFNSGSMLGSAPIGRGPGSEVLIKLQNALGEVYKTANPDAEITVIPLDNTNETALNFSCLIIAMRTKSALDAGVAYHTLVLEATGDKIPLRFDNIGGKQIEVMRLTGDAVNDILMKAVGEKVYAAFPQSKSFSSEYCVVPRTFNPEDKVAVHNLALNAIMANVTELSLRDKTFADLNLAETAKDSSLLVDLKFSQQQIENAVGEPMRSDVLIAFTSQQNTPQQQGIQELNTGDKIAKVSELSAFIDLVWAPVSAQTGGYNAFAPQQPQNTQKYAARMVITNLQSNLASTPATTLLALATSLSIRDNNNWIHAFKPTPTESNSVDTHDIGALAIEANFTNNSSGYGDRVDTKINTFRPENIGQLVSALIQPGMMVSMDIPECGPQTWYSNLFPAASNGDQGAVEAIFTSANQLTNGLFEKHFPRNSQMFTDLGNRIHLGYYTDKSHTKRDIRDIDYLAVANILGERSPQDIRGWSDTFARTDYPLAERLSVRKRMIMNLTGESAEFTGYAQRVTFTHAFMQALGMACSEAGLNIRIQTPLNSGDFNNERGVAGFIGSALMQTGGSTIFNRGFGGQQNFAGNFAGVTSRFNRF